MPSARLILCEKSLRWAAVLRSALGNKQPQLVETRSLPGCFEALALSPASFVAIEITPANLDAAIDFFSRLSAGYPNAAIVALLSPELQAAGPLLREAGAIDVAFSVLDAPCLARLAQRHFEQSPLEPLTLRQFVASRLPWPAHATNANAR